MSVTEPAWAHRFLATAMANAARPVPGTEAVRLGANRWERVGNGIVIITPSPPAAPAPSAPELWVISAAIHGDETAPAEMLDRIIADLAGGDLALVHPLLVILGHPAAVVAGTRFIDENLNRLFSGRHRRHHHPEARRAAELERAVADFFARGPVDVTRRHFDLHTTIRAAQLERFAIQPHGQELSSAQLDLLRRADIQAVLLFNAPAGTFSYYSANQFGAEAMTLELGRVAPLGRNDPAQLAAIDQTLRAALAGGPLPPVRSEPRIFVVEHELLRSDDPAFTLHLGSDVENFAPLAAGYRLVSDRHGDLVVPGPGRRIVFPNPDVPIGQRVGLLVVEQHPPGS